MDIEDIEQRETYRDFDLVLLRMGKAIETRWHITHKESGMNRSYGFAISELEARRMIDALHHQSGNDG